jgi:hypothetical protein
MGGRDTEQQVVVSMIRKLEVQKMRHIITPNFRRGAFDFDSHRSGMQGSTM